jgi:hypothetical protein
MHLGIVSSWEKEDPTHCALLRIALDRVGAGLEG